MNYNYTISASFPSGLAVGQLQQEILDDPAITTILVGLVEDFDADDLIIRFVAGLSGPELTALNNVIANHVPAAQPTINPTGTVVNYTLSNMVYRANDISFSTISKFPWDQSRYSRYCNGTVVMNVTYYNRSLEFVLYDTTNAIAIGTGVISSTGISNYSILSPTSNTSIELRIRKTQLGGQDPELNTCSMEFIS